MKLTSLGFCADVGYFECNEFLLADGTLVLVHTELHAPQKVEDGTNLHVLL